MYQPTETFPCVPTKWEWQPDVVSPAVVVTNVMTEQSCLLDAFFREEQKKPPHLRQRAAFISCPCPKCRPMCL